MPRKPKNTMPAIRTAKRSPDGTPWPKARKRSSTYLDVAYQFIQNHPHGTDLKTGALDEFAQALHVASNGEKGYVKVASDDPQDDAYRAMILRRKELRERINTAARNPAFREMYGVEGFSIDVISAKDKDYRVNSLLDAMDVEALAQKIASLLTSDQTKINHIVQAIPYLDLNPIEQFRILSGYESFQRWKRGMAYETDELSRTLDQVKAIYEKHTLKPMPHTEVDDEIDEPLA